MKNTNKEVENLTGNDGERDWKMYHTTDDMPARYMLAYDPNTEDVAGLADVDDVLERIYRYGEEVCVQSSSTPQTWYLSSTVRSMIAYKKDEKSYYGV